MLGADLEGAFIVSSDFFKIDLFTRRTHFIFSTRLSIRESIGDIWRIIYPQTRCTFLFQEGMNIHPSLFNIQTFNIQTKLNKYKQTNKIFTAFIEYVQANMINKEQENNILTIRLVYRGPTLYFHGYINTGIIKLLNIIYIYCLLIFF